MPSLPHRFKPVRAPGPHIPKNAAKKRSVRRHDVRRTRTPPSRSPRPLGEEKLAEEKPGGSDAGGVAGGDAGGDASRDAATDTASEGMDEFEDSDDAGWVGKAAGFRRFRLRRPACGVGGASRARSVLFAVLACASAALILWKFPIACVVPVAILPLFMKPRWVAIAAPVVLMGCYLADNAFVWGMSGVWLAYIACMFDAKPNRKPNAMA